MTYRIEEIEGIGPSYGQRLSAVSIDDTASLLERCGDREGRKRVSQETGISAAQLLKWANMADLMRISGVGHQYAELLEAAGVDTVLELQHRNADNLAAAMKQVNDERSLSKQSPGETAARHWIQEAKELPPMISH